MVSDNGSINIGGEKITAEQIPNLIYDTVDSIVNQHLSHHHSAQHHIHGLDPHPDFHGLPEADRRHMVESARAMVISNPVARQVKSLWTNYGVGSKYSFRAQSAKAGKILEAITRNPDNRCIFSSFGQRKTSDIKIVDGEIFFAIFGKGEQTKYRRIDTLQISDIAYDPNDIDSPRYYVRSIGGLGGMPERQIIYADWRNRDLLDGVFPDGTRINVNTTGAMAKVKFLNKDGNEIYKQIPTTYQAGAVMYHDLFDGTGRRGDSLLIASLPWMRAQNLFMRDRVSIMSGLAQFIFKIKTKGGSAAVDYIQNQLNSTLSTTNSTDDNPKYTAGSSFVSNENVNLESMKQETGADSARVDGEALMNMATVGAGVFTQYTGTGNLQNYAQANTMEGPMFKQWSAYQEGLENMYQTLFQIALMGLVKRKDELVVVDTPELIRKDTPAMIDAVTKLFSVMPELAGSDEMKLQILTLFDIDNPNLVLEQIEAARTPIETNEQSEAVEDD